MGLFDLFKKKGVDDQTFHSLQFQQEMLAFGLWKYGENGDLGKVRRELLGLQDVKLNERQADIIVAKLREMLESPEGNAKIGQVWQYKTREGESQSRATIFKIDRMETETIIHISLDNLHIGNKSNPEAEIKTVGHLPIAVAAFEKSVTALDRQNPDVPTINEGYEQWRSVYNIGKAGVFDVEIREIVQFIEDSANQ